MGEIGELNIIRVRIKAVMFLVTKHIILCSYTSCQAVYAGPGVFCILKLQAGIHLS